jgi:DNA adenine methylase
VESFGTFYRYPVAMIKKLIKERYRGLSPLRYPGGKAKIGAFIERILQENDLIGGHYGEPYAGGAGVAFRLLLNGYVDQVHLNDVDASVYAVWRSIIDEPDAFCRMISSTRVSMAQWRRQHAVQERPKDHSTLELGFSTFFLNRTNRSGIIKGGGVIGGVDQDGEWKIDARYYKKTLINRIEWIASQSKRITLHKLDAEEFMKKILNAYTEKMLVYLDPPYYVKGHRLYEHHYEHADHERVAKFVQSDLKGSWIVSYDDNPAIRNFYCARRYLQYGVPYSATSRSVGNEVMFFSDDLRIPDIMPCCAPINPEPGTA